MTEHESPTVTVRGVAMIRAEPDEATLVISLTALDQGPGAALADVSQRSRRLVALLDELGVVPSDRSTSGVSVHEEFDYTSGGGRRSLGHRAASTVAARLTDVETIGQLITRATTELGARIDGPQWQVALDNPIRLEAARAAAAAGRRKAQAYADGVGARLGKAVKVSEPLDAPYARRAAIQPLAARAVGEEPPMPIEAGELQIAVAVEVTFALEVA